MHRYITMYNAQLNESSDEEGVGDGEPNPYGFGTVLGGGE